MRVDESPCEQLQHVISRNRQGQAVGIYSVCSAHRSVLEAAMRQALEDGSLLCVESTSNQVNQEGGYTGLTPGQFIDYLSAIAHSVSFPSERLLLGGDHLGPYPWRDESASSALEKARVLVQSCVRAGYAKIHLDASMACADEESVQLDDERVAKRAAALCRAAEDAWAELPDGSSRPVYVIGTEVPVPGGETAEGLAPRPTTLDHVQKTVEITRNAFLALGLQGAWDRVIGLVVQPGVEFGNAIIFDYQRERALTLSRNLPRSPSLVYEAHSTDYQSALALRQMVEDHFGILKVGPWLTFAYREAIFALSALEGDWLGAHKNVRISRVREALETAMLANPVHWKAYYPADGPDGQFAREYSFSDRCRYYWPEPLVQQEVDGLLANLGRAEIPLSLISQYFPDQYEAIRNGHLRAKPQELIEDRIRQVLRFYSAACGHS